MPKPSFTQKLGNKPSRSYLSSPSLGDIDQFERGSVLSYRSGGGDSINSYSAAGARRDRRQDGTGDSLRGSVNGDPRRFSTLPSSRTFGSILRGSKTASSDAGVAYTSSSSLRRSGTMDSRTSQHRRSVTFSDAGPSYYDGGDDRTNERFAVMSDMGLPYGSSHRKRTPSITSSIMSDNLSDAGSTATRRSGVRRGNKSERAIPQQALNLWHNDLGGPGLVKRSPTSGTVKTTNDNALTSIVKRKSSAAANRMSPSRLVDLANAQPSRRYSTPTTASANGTAGGSQDGAGTGSAGGRSDGGYPQRPSPTRSSARNRGRDNTLAVPTLDTIASSGASSSGGSSPAGSEASFTLRTMQHSRHTRKQRIESNLDANVGTGSDAAAGLASADVMKRPAGMSRSSSTSSTGSSKKVKAKSTAPTGTDAVPPVPTLLHSDTLRNTLLSAPPPTLKKGKTRSAEQIVEALSKAGLLDRVMEAVQEADEEGDLSSGGRSRSSSPVPPPVRDSDISASVPTVQETSAPEAAPSHVSGGPSPLPSAANVPTSHTAVQHPVQTATPGPPTSQPIQRSEALPLALAPLVMPAAAFAATGAFPATGISRNNSTSRSSTRGVPEDTPTNEQYYTPPAYTGTTDAFSDLHHPIQDGPVERAIEQPTKTAQIEPPAESKADPVQSDSNLQSRQSLDGPPVTQSEGLVPVISASPAITPPRTPSPPKKQQHVIVQAGSLPLPESYSNPVRLETLISVVSPSGTGYSSRSLEGTVLVLAAEASAVNAFIRLTWNNWSSFEEIPTRHTTQEPPAPEIARHTFEWYLPPGTPPSEVNVQLALRLRNEQTGQEFWDNNAGQNYSATLPAVSASTSASMSRASSGSKYSTEGRATPVPAPMPGLPMSTNSLNVSQEPQPMAATSQAMAPSSSREGAPRVLLTRTQSDDHSGPSVLHDPSTEEGSSQALNGGSTNVPGTAQAPAMYPVTPVLNQANVRAIPDHILPESQVPLPAGRSNHRSISNSGSTASTPSNGTPAASLNGDARSYGTAATSNFTPATSANSGQISAIPKHVLNDKPSNEHLHTPNGSVHGDAPSSRAQSTTSRGSADSTNVPFAYPRGGGYQASVASSNAMQQSSNFTYPSGPRGGRPDFAQQEMPSIMSALDAHPHIANDLSGIYTNSTNSNAASRSNTINHHDNGPRKSRSVISDNASIGGRSASALSSMSVPVASRYGPVNKTIESKPGSAIASGIVSLPKSNTTMCALTVTSNATQTLGHRGFLRTKKTAQNYPSLPPHLANTMTSNAVITYSNLTPVPHKIRSDECLVQVFTSAIDFWDRAKVEILTTRGQGYGFIPGRAFVGKVLETGTDVDPKKVRKGDFVYGLNDLKKSGALGEYLAVERSLLTRAPNGVLTLEQIAAIALSGIAAYQSMDELCSTLARGSKLVILNAHEGVGAIALQLAQALRPAMDLWIIGHFPPDFADGDSILRALGASETLCGEAVSAVKSLRESSYDAVLDTIGGRQIYDASKIVLHDDGYFVTTVGDALSVPTSQAHWKQSLKAIFRRKEKRKNIRYWFPSVLDDQRAALDRMREICEAGQLKPVVKRVYKFEDGMKAFQGPNEQAVIMLLDQDKM